MDDAQTKPRLSQQAAIVIALADTVIPSYGLPEDEAESWVRILRLYGEVGCALLSLGVPAGPLETPARDPAERIGHVAGAGHDAVERVRRRAIELAGAEGADSVGTVDILFALIATYETLLDGALRSRGTTREELLDRLRERSSPAPCGLPIQVSAVGPAPVAEVAAPSLRNVTK